MGIWIGSKTYVSNSWTMAVLERTDTQRGSEHTGNTKERGYSERDRGTAGDRRRWTLRREKWMMAVNLGDLENISGEQEQYWLVGFKAAREAARLKRQRTMAQQGG
jgi:hypothetical protein